MVYDRPSSESFTGRVEAPDGTIYLVVMEGWYWNSLDWIHENTEWNDRDFIRMAWNCANQPSDVIGDTRSLQSRFIYFFKAHIYYHMTDILNKEDGIIDDNINI